MVRLASRGKIKLSIALIAAACLIFFLISDLRLPDAIERVELPDVKVENLDFHRNISGREWRIKAFYAEKNASLFTAERLELQMKDASSGRGASINAARGEFDGEISALSIRSLDGILSFNGRDMAINARSARYLVSDDVWVFEDGVKFWDGDLVIEAGSADIVSRDIIHLGGRAIASWNME